MSSENRAAHALGRTYPGGLPTFVGLMNAKAQHAGHERHPLRRADRPVQQEPVQRQGPGHAGQCRLRRSGAARVVHLDRAIRWKSGDRTLQYNNTNRLVKNPDWDIGLQKTGYISEAGQCLVMQAKVAGRKLIMVFLDSAGKLSRLGDAERVRRWVESNPAKPSAPVLTPG